MNGLIEHIYAECRYIECHCAESRGARPGPPMKKNEEEQTEVGLRRHDTQHKEYLALLLK